MHFWELCLMKNTLFLKKKWRKIHFFIAFSAIFRDFCGIEKNSQVQNFWRILQGGPVNYRLIMGRSWADENDIKGFLYFNKQIKNKKMKKISQNIFEKFKK